MAELDSGGSGGSTGGDSTSDSDSGGSFNGDQITLQALGLGWIPQYEDVLKAFGKRPIQFVAGAVFTLILNGFEAIVTALLDAVLAVGDAVAAIPELSAGVLIDAGRVVGATLIDTVRLVNEPLLTAAQATGPLAPIVGAAIIVIEVIIVINIAQLGIRVLLDVVPGLGGLV